MMKKRLWWVVLSVGAALAAPSAAAANGPQPFGHACAVESGGLRFCPTPAPSQSSDQRVRSWDGTPLQVDVTLPATGNGPWPTIVMLPGYGGSDGVSWDGHGGSTTYGSAGDDYSANWFAQHGYAAVTMNFRGVGYSCGPVYAQSATTDVNRLPGVGACQNVNFEFADQRYDARDVQSVLGQLVDEGLAKPDALGATGESLGSLVTSELALLYNRVRLLNGGFAPWKSPAGVPLHIAAAYPIWGIADLMEGVAPNGRFLSFEPRTATSDGSPIGAIKLSVPMSIAAESPEATWTVPSTTGFDLLTDSVYSELAAPDGPGASALVDEIRNYHQAVGMPLGSGVAPILIEDGWDDLVVDGAGQALRLKDYLQRAPQANIAMQLTDVGHAVAANKPADMDPLDLQATAFFDHYLQGVPGGPAPGSVTAYTSTCPVSAASGGPYEAQGMAALDPGAVRFSSAAAQTVAAGGDPTIGVALDPIVGTGEESAQSGSDPQCQTFTASDEPGTAVYTQPVTRTFTMLGLPTMRMHVAKVGNDGQIDARLWDVAPNGSETYVSRGTYALTNDQTGTITWQMWGSGYTFPKGDTMRVELLAQDVPLERPAPRPFAVTVSDFTIELPSHEAPDGGAIVKPVLAREQPR